MIGITYLNICAAQSQIGKHEDALQSATYGRDYCQSNLDSLLEKADQQDKEQIIEKIRYVAISYHNMGVEQEFLQRNKDALNSYKNACKIFEEHNASEEPLLLKFKQAYDKAKQVI